ncbi:MAG: CHAT domain-containing protein [Anaerolineales bacterium]
MMPDPSLEKIDETIYELRESLSAIHQDTSERAEILFNLGDQLIQRYGLSRHLQDLDESISLFQEAVIQSSLDQTWFSSSKGMLGVGQLYRYLTTGHPEDLERSIGNEEQALEIVPRDSPWRSEFAETLCIALLERYWRFEQSADLDKAFQVLQDVSEDVDLTRGPLRYLNEKESVQDLERRIRSLRTDIQKISPNDPDLLPVRYNLSLALKERYVLSGRLADLNEFINLLGELTEANTSDANARATYLNDHGAGLMERYFRHGEHAEDLEEAILNFKESIENSNLNAHNLSLALNNLGLALIERFAQDQRMEDLDGAISNLNQAVEVVSRDAPERLMMLNDLAEGLMKRFEATFQIEDLDQAIQLFEEAIDLLPEPSTQRSKRLNALGAARHSRYYKTEQMEDLEAAIQDFSEAIDGMPSEAKEDRLLYLDNLCRAQIDHYNQTQSTEDLRNLIDTSLDAMKLIPSKSPEMAKRFSALAAWKLHEYDRTGQIDALDVAIRLAWTARRVTPKDSPELPTYLAGLADGLMARSSHTRNIDDLEQAIRLFEEALKKSDPDSPDRANYLNQLGSGLVTRYHRLGHAQDLERAIQLINESINLNLADSSTLVGSLNTLGETLMARYWRDGRLEDLDEAIRLFDKAAQETPSNTINHSFYLGQLAYSLLIRFERTSDAADKARAVNSYRMIFSSEIDVPPDIALENGSDWGDWASSRQNWEEAAEAYAHAINALGQLYQNQFLREGKELWLREAQGVFIRAAFAQAKAGHPREAVITLEQSRARSLIEAIGRDRTDMESVRLAAPEAFEEFMEGANMLRTTEFKPRSSFLSSSDWRGLSPEERDQRNARLHLESAIEHIRQIDGFANFLANPQWQDVAQAVEPGTPLVYLLVAYQGGLAIILHRGGEDDTESQITVDPIFLDKFDFNRLFELLFGPKMLSASSSDPDRLGGWFGSYLNAMLNFPGWLDMLDSCTRNLWDGMMELVIEHLQSIGAQQAILIPTGPLAHLPLHAAWTQVDGRRIYAGEQIALSYAPSARAICEARRIAGKSQSDRLLIVGEPQPVSQGSDLPHTHTEVKAIASFFESKSELTRRDAQRESVRKSLPAAEVAHFSCHGLADITEPEQSGLIMADNVMLTVQDLFQLHLAGARLAVLSACETGAVSLRLPDEAIGLPAAFFRAGFAGVVGSLWPVADLSTAMLMERFYRAWRDEKLSPVRALQKAQTWLRETTNRQKADYYRVHIPSLVGTQPAQHPASNDSDFQGTQLPEDVAAEFFTHLVADPRIDERLYDHPFWWAAFYFMGV